MYKTVKLSARFPDGVVHKECLVDEDIVGILLRHDQLLNSNELKGLSIDKVGKDCNIFFCTSHGSFL